MTQENNQHNMSSHHFENDAHLLFKKNSVATEDDAIPTCTLPIFLQTMEKDFFQSNTVVEPDLLRKARKKAWEKFQEIGFPTKDDEAFQYCRFLTNMKEECYLSLLATEGNKKDTASTFLPECQESAIVFLNGYFRPDLSSTKALQEITIQPLVQATRSFSAFLSTSWNKSISDEVDPLSLLSLSCFQDGIFIYVPPKKCIKEPIHIVYIYDEVEAPSWAMPRVHMIVGRHARASVIETTKCLGQNTRPLYINSHILFELESCAQLHHTYVAFDSADMRFCIHTGSVRAYLKEYALLTSTSYTIPSIASRRSYKVWLQGQAAQANIHGSWMLSKEQENHCHVHIQHDAPHCQSMQLFKGVIQNSSRSSFEGKIYVSQQAQKTQAYQRNNNLVLGSDAKAFSKPNLEIYADDVKASHGATTGQLDTDSLFYLQTRGLPKELAQICLIEGFLSEIASNITTKSIHDHVVGKIHSFCS